MLLVKLKQNPLRNVNFVEKSGCCNNPQDGAYKMYFNTGIE